MSDKAEPKRMPPILMYVFGGTAGMTASCFVHPFDFVKTRMQVSGKGGKKGEYRSLLHCMQSVASTEGPLAFYRGLSGSLLRQGTYTTARVGLFIQLNAMYENHYGTRPTFVASTAMGLAAGVFGAFVGTPAEVGLVRMMSDGMLPPAERRNYRNVVHALVHIAREEGVRGLFRGAAPTMARAITVNISLLSVYSQMKFFLTDTMGLEDRLWLNFPIALVTGVVNATLSLPLDIAKTRIQNMKITDGKPEYTGTVDAIVKVCKHEGVLALWKGFIPFSLRPQNVIMIIVLQQMTHAYNKYVLKDEGKRSSL